MMTVEPGYTVAYELAQVIALAELAVAAESTAAMEISQDGSRLRFNAGPQTILAALGDEGRTIGTRMTLTFTPNDPVTSVESRNDISDLDFMRGCLAEGGKRLYLTRSHRQRSGWLMTCNPTLDQRKPPYDVPERYKVMCYTSPGPWHLLDLETGLAYRAKPGQAALQGSRSEMETLAGRLNAS
ncbi:hypothetical protein [Nonomuraea helvata]|uniref:Uncharacterized protein n=1 Tax=Nonomuraea helvata TaxID=37484 RepID=A0ABV5SI04_9ACTN